jgi:hypothetical protein
MPRIPLFPLRAVLVPGLVLPLHIFEPRYRLMVRMLAGAPEGERGFGVVALRPGASGEDPESLYPVGTVARLAEVTELEDGRYDIITVGASRFRIGSVNDDLPFRRADVTWLPEDVGVAQAQAHELSELAGQAAALLGAYRKRIAGWGVIDVPEIPHLPCDPTALSYLVAAALVADLAVHQEFLAIPTTAQRLRAECRWLRAELSVMRAVPSLPAVDLAGERGRAN